MVANERDELIAWIQRNRQLLHGRTADEVAYLARMNNFTPQIVYEVLSHGSPIGYADAGSLC